METQRIFSEMRQIIFSLPNKQCLLDLIRLKSLGSVFMFLDQ